MAIIGVKEVMKITGMGVSKSYELIRLLNDELEAEGYLTLRGKVESEYLRERLRLRTTEDYKDARGS